MDLLKPLKLASTLIIMAVVSLAIISPAFFGIFLSGKKYRAQRSGGVR